MRLRVAMRQAHRHASIHVLLLTNDSGDLPPALTSITELVA